MRETIKRQQANSSVENIFSSDNDLLREYRKKDKFLGSSANLFYCAPTT